jgi:hypothetical protein
LGALGLGFVGVSPWFGLILFIVAALFLAWDPRPSLAPGFHAKQDWEPWFLAALMLAAAWVRLYDLAGLPHTAHGHEGEMVSRLLSLRQEPYTPHIADPNINWPSLIFYQALASISAFGWNPAAYRLPGALWGCLALPLFYGCARRFMGPLAAAGATVLFACDQQSLVQSRNLFPGILNTVGLLGSLLFLWRAVDKGRLREAAIAGFFTALALWGYMPGRLVPLLVLLWLGFLAWGLPAAQRGERPWGRLAALWFLSALLLYLPVLVFALRHPDQFWGYLRVANPNAGKGPLAYLRTLWDQWPDYARMFHLRGDSDPGTQIPGRPTLDFASRILFPLGAFYLLLRRPGARRAFLWPWLLLGLVPALLGGGGFAHPTTRRAVLAMPAVFLMVGVALDRLLIGFASLPRALVRPAMGLVLALCLAGAGASLHSYFFEYFADPGVQAQVDSVNPALYELAQAYPGDALCFSAFFQGGVYQKSQPFYFPVRPIHALDDPDGLLSLDPEPHSLVLLDGLYGDAQPLGEALWPRSPWLVGAAGPRWREALVTKDPFSPQAFYVGWRVDEDSITALQGLKDANPPDPALRPGSVELKGGFEVPGGAGRVLCMAPRGLLLRVDGRAVSAGRPLDLAVGYHQFSVAGHGSAPDQSRVRVSAASTELPLTALDWPYGMLESLWRGETEGPGAPVQTRRLLLPAYRYQADFPLPDPFCASIRGILSAPADGSYRFSLPDWCRGTLLVDGQPAFSADQDRRTSFGHALPWKAGSAHSLEFRLGPMRAAEPERGFQILWIPPGSEDWEPLDPKDIRPAF